MGEGSTDEARGAALARYYDLDLTDDPGDLDLYAALAQGANGPILELAAGSGRIAIPLAAAGHTVTGVDIDPDMLDRARLAWTAHAAAATRGGTAERGATAGRAKPGATDKGATSGSLDLLEADLLALDLGARFALVILAFNGLLLLGDRRAQLDALRVMARHLRDDGRAVVDIWLPSPDDLVIYDGRTVLEWTRDDEATGARVAKTVSATDDTATATVTLTQWFDAWPTGGGGVHRVDRVDRLRLVGADELVAMVESAGMTVDSLGGDYAMTPFGPGAERVIVIARPTDTGRLV